MDIRVENVKPLVGGVVHVTKEQMFAPGFADKCLEILKDRGALVFPQVNLTDAEQLAFTDSLGDRVNYTTKIPGGDVSAQDVYTITLDKDTNSEPEYVWGSMYWHMDGICSPIPPSTRMPTSSGRVCGGMMTAARRGAWAPALSSRAATGTSARSGRRTRSPAATPSAAAMRLSQPTDTVRVPVSRRPMVCGVVGGLHRAATS